MMIDRIRAAVERDGRADDYMVVERRKHGVEWYLSGDSVDMARSVDTTTYSLVVMVDGAGGDGARTRGSCGVTLHPGSGDGEILAALSRAVRAASGMRNPWYPLPERGPAAAAMAEGGFGGRPLERSMEGLREAIRGARAGGPARLNSVELFLSRHERRIVNSRGLDVSWASHAGYAEYIVSASAPGLEEVELFGDIEFSEPDHDRLAAIVRHRLGQASDRLVAVPTPAVDGLPVLFRDELAAQVYGYWFAAAKAQAAYEKTASCGLGESLGDGLDLVAVPSLPGNPRSAPYDMDGQALSPVHCVEGGILRSLVGPLKYTQYLGLPAHGDLPLFELAPGLASAADLASAPHLEASSFSDFFVDDTTGDFGGELRLGYVVRDGRRTPVRGGSVTGSMVANRGLVRLSSERESTPACRAPAACLVPKASISAG